MGISFSSTTTTTTTTTTTRRNTTPLHPYSTLQPHHLEYYSSYSYPSHPSPYPAQSPSPPVYHQPFYNSNSYGVCDHAIGQPYFCPYEWPPVPPPQMVAPDNKPIKVVNSEVNVHKDSLRLEVDELKPHCYLVSFDFDALVDGSITICYFAKEETGRRIGSIFPEAYVPIIASFRKGLNQEFRQPSGTGIDFSLFRLEDLSSSISRDDVFPILISAETRPPSYMVERSYLVTHEFPQRQISQITVAKNNGQFIPKVVRQVLWTDDICYELREIYGLGKSSPGSSDNGSGKDCVICMSEPKDVIVLPCRHMCMCSDCANELRLQSNRCPICRETIEELLPIKLENMS